MENFKHRNKEIEFWSVTGEIMAQNKYSETHVSSREGANKWVAPSSLIARSIFDSALF